MTIPGASGSLDDLKRPLLLGLTKSGTAQAPDTLAALAIIAMRSRFRRPQRPAAREAEPLPDDPRPLLPDEARPLLLRLCAGPQVSSSDTLAQAAVDALNRAGLRPHPFDFSRLEDLVVRFAADLGPTAAAWGALVRPGRDTAETGAKIVTEETLAEAGKAAKLAFLRERRKTLPARARELIAELLPKEAAALRADLIALLALGLSAEDTALLTAAAADRAQSVRETAASLLARIPGTQAYAAKLARVSDHVTVPSRRVGRPKAIEVAGPSLPGDLLDGLRLDDLAHTLGIDVPQLAVLAAASPELDVPVLLQVVAERRYELVPHFEGCLGSRSGAVLADVLQESMPPLSAADQEALLRSVMGPSGWTALPHAGVLGLIYELARRPLPADIAGQILASAAFADALEKARGGSAPHFANAIEAMAPLVPNALSERYLGAAADVTRRGALLHRFILALPVSQ
jgi:hypothetical protein